MEVVLHVGMLRTGSTFLQREVFKKSDSVNDIIQPRLYNFVFNEDKINVISD